MFALAATLGLGGCSSTVSGVNPANPTPAPTANPGLSVATQRTEAQAGIVVAEGIQVASLLDVLVNAFISSQSSDIHSEAVCKNGVEYTVVAITPEQLKITIDTFYDLKCTTLQAHAVLKTTFFAPSNLSIAGTATFYDTNGKAVAYGTLSNKTTLTNPGAHGVTTGTIAQKRGGSGLSFGLTCTFAKTSDCGFGGVAPVSSSQALGVATTLDGFTGQGSVTGGTTTVDGYTGTPGALKLTQGSGDTWKIRGGKLAVSLLGTFDENVDATSFDVTGSLNLQDAKNNALVTLAFGTRTGIQKGSVSSLAQGIGYATFSTDATGTGTIDYSSGTGNIVLFLITS
jgi:hypothetical protein